MKKKSIKTRSYLDLLEFDPSLLQSPMAVLLRNIRIVYLAIVALVIAGTASFINLPRELNPEVNIPIVSVVTTLPGADPLDVEELVTDKLESELNDIADLDRMSSSSQSNVSIITLEFQSNADIDKVLQEVKDRVDIVTDLPEQAEVPSVRKIDFNDEAVLTVALVGTDDTQTLTIIARKVADELEKKAEIRSVVLGGDHKTMVKVEVSPQSLTEHSLSLQQIESAIRNNSLKVPVGKIQVNKTEYQLSFDTKVSSIQDIRDLPLSVNTAGAPLTVGDIAVVYETVEDTDSIVSYYKKSGEEFSSSAAVQLSIFKSNQASIIDAVAVAQEELNILLSDYKGIKFVQLINEAKEVQDSFTELSGNFASTIGLVFLVLFLFLGLRQASIASLSVPLTFLSTFIIMQVLGITLNFLSLFSLLLALGLVVDDAIVIVQASSKYSEKFNPQETGLLVFRDFVVPIWTTTITTIWAFVPLLLSTGIIGEFIKSIPIVVTATLLSSTSIAVLINLPATVVLSQLKVPPRVRWFFQLLFGLIATAAIVSISKGSKVSPLVVIVWLIFLFLAYYSKKQVIKGVNDFWLVIQSSVISRGLSDRFDGKKLSKAFDSGFITLDPLVDRYKKITTTLLENKKKRVQLYILLAAFFVISTLIFPMTGLLKVEFFPKTDQDNIFVTVEGASGWPVEQTEKVLEDIASTVLSEEEITEVVSRTGSIPSFQGTGGSSSGSHLGYLTIRLSDGIGERGSIALAESLRAKFDSYNQAKINVVEMSGGPPAGADLSITITGDDLQILETIANDFTKIIIGLKDGKTQESLAVNVASSLSITPGQLMITIDKVAAEERGIQAFQIAAWLRTSISGSDALNISLNEDDVPVSIALPESAQNLDTLFQTQLPGLKGPYLVSEVAKLTLETSPTEVTHIDGVRQIQVSATANEVAAPELLSAFESAVSDYDLPDGYTWKAGGVNEENQESTNSIIQAMGLSALLIMVTMVVQLHSFRQSFLVLSVIPLAVAGVFFNFTVFDIPLSFPALIGVLALFGIVVNNSIMLVEKINQNHSLGMEYVHGIVDACSVRLEAIIFTSLTTAFGLLPITISDPLWRGLGGAIIAGLSVSGFLILFLLPSLMIDIFGVDGKKE